MRIRILRTYGIIHFNCSDSKSESTMSMSVANDESEYIPCWDDACSNGPCECYNGISYQQEPILFVKYINGVMVMADSTPIAADNHYNAIGTIQADDLTPIAADNPYNAIGTIQADDLTPIAADNHYNATGTIQADDLTPIASHNVVQKNLRCVTKKKQVGVSLRPNRQKNRPRKNHSERKTSILKEWLSLNTRAPYPNKDQKKQLVKLTKLSLLQINVWFVNTRKRERMLAMKVFEK